MPLPTPKQLNDNEESLLLSQLRNLMKRVSQLEGRANARTNFTNAAGAHVVVGVGDPFNIEDPFTGTAILFPAYAHASGDYHIFGMNAGVLQWGASATDGKIYFGGGDGWLDEIGLEFLNQEGQVAFQDTSGDPTMSMYAAGDNWLEFANQFGGTGIRFNLDDAVHVVTEFIFDPNGQIRIDGDVIYPIQNSESVLGSVFNITGTAGTFQDTGLSVTLPSAGTYRIHSNARAQLTANGGAGTTAWWISIELYNTTDAAVVANSERLAVLTAANAQQFQMTCPLDAVVTVAASKTIKLYACRNGNGTPAWTTSNIESNSAGRTVLSYEKIG